MQTGANPAGNHLTVDGLTATDVLNFAAALSGAVITHPNAATEAVTIGTEVTTLHWATHAAEVAAQANIHWSV
jgi:hypothetical protein